MLPYQLQATTNIFTSWHEILATGCILPLPKASNLFHGVASRAAFHFVLGVAFCFVAVDFFFVVIEDGLDFEVVCFVLVCVEAV